MIISAAMTESMLFYLGVGSSHDLQGADNQYKATTVIPLRLLFKILFIFIPLRAHISTQMIHHAE